MTERIFCNTLPDSSWMSWCMCSWQSVPYALKFLFFFQILSEMAEIWPSNEPHRKLYNFKTSTHISYLLSLEAYGPEIQTQITVWLVFGFRIWKQMWIQIQTYTQRVTEVWKARAFSYGYGYGYGYKESQPDCVACRASAPLHLIPLFCYSFWDNLSACLLQFILDDVTYYYYIKP